MGQALTGHSWARVRISSKDPRAQYSVIMQGGLEQAPRNMTMLGWRSTDISCVSLRSSSRTELLLDDLCSGLQLQMGSGMRTKVPFLTAEACCAQEAMWSPQSNAGYITQSMY